MRAFPKYGAAGGGRGKGLIFQEHPDPGV